MKAPIFIHNPKAASTSIRSAIKQIRTPSARTIHLPVRDRKVRSQIRDAGANAWVFGVVRHPLDRALSAFHYWKAPRRRTIPEFTVLESMCEGMDVNEFFRYVNLPKLAKVVPHFQRQMWFFAGGKIDQFLYFENLDEDFKTLCDNLEIPHVNLPKKRTTSHAPWFEEMDEHTQEKLMNFYMADFRAFYMAELEDDA